jgi:hypothetical protein
VGHHQAGGVSVFFFLPFLAAPHSLLSLSSSLFSLFKPRLQSHASSTCQHHPSHPKPAKKRARSPRFPLPDRLERESREREEESRRKKPPPWRPVSPSPSGACVEEEACTLDRPVRRRWSAAYARMRERETRRGKGFSSPLFPLSLPRARAGGSMAPPKSSHGVLTDGCPRVGGAQV